MESLSNPGAQSPGILRESLSPGTPVRRTASVSVPTLPLTVHALLPAAAIYFFFNQAGLPLGLFYTTMLSPLFYVWLLLKGQRWVSAKFLLGASPFIIAHLVNGISSPFFYARSLLLMWTAYITVYAFCLALMRSRRIERLFDDLIGLNFCAAMLALILFFTPAQQVFFHEEEDRGMSDFHRLSLLSSEPSVYALLMLPLITFSALRVIRKASTRNLIVLGMIVIPFLLSQSVGGISMCLAGLLASMIVSHPKLLTRPSSLAIICCVAFMIAVALLIPSPMSTRVLHVLSGSDSSTNSRTIYSFIVAFTVAASKSLWWGIGLGQGKLFDVSDLGLGFEVGTIPNAMAGTFAELGIVGVLARIGVEIFLFFKTKVYRNSFRTAMFVIAFITQFTGSYLGNVQECLIWCMAFITFFPDMDTVSPGNQPMSGS